MRGMSRRGGRYTHFNESRYMGRGWRWTYVVDPGGGALVPLAVGREAVDHVEHTGQAQHWDTRQAQISTYWSG